MVGEVGLEMKKLSNQEDIRPGQHFFGGGHGFYYMIRLIDEKVEREQIIANYATANWGYDSNLYEFVPTFPYYHPYDDDYDDLLTEWGRSPPAPDGHDGITTSILYSWEEHKTFLMYIDGDMTNNRIDNLIQVDLATALSHVGEDGWTVNWASNLDDDEEEFVLEHLEYFIDVAKVLFRPPASCASCGWLPTRSPMVTTLLADTTTDNGNNNKTKKKKKALKFCSRCKYVQYCCVSCQKKDWKLHKGTCEAYNVMMTVHPSQF